MIRKGDFQIANLVSTATLLFVMITVVGCASSSGLGRDGLPSKKYLVGGGIWINWTAPQEGIAYLVEETTGRIMMTKSLQANEEVELSGPAESEEVEELLGIQLADAKFYLYFIPLAQKKHRNKVNMNTTPPDTTIDAAVKQTEILRRIGISGRAKMTFELSENLRRIVEPGKGRLM